MVVNGANSCLAGRKGNYSHAACGVSLVFQTGYKQAFHFIKDQILALMVVPFFRCLGISGRIRLSQVK